MSPFSVKATDYVLFIDAGGEMYLLSWVPSQAVSKYEADGRPVTGVLSLTLC